MTVTQDSRTTPAAVSPTRRRLALLAMALGSFGIGGSEFIAMGLLPGMAEGLLPELMAANPEAGIARAGMVITAYAVGVVVGAPTLALLSVRFSRTTMIIALAVSLTAGAVLSALMPTFELTVLARFLAGLPHGAFLGIASLLAATLMGPGNQGKGVAVALSGIAVANLVGVPALTAIGQVAGWRAVYLLLAGIFLIAAVALYLTVPHVPRVPNRRILDELVALRRIQVWIVIVSAAVGFGGLFAVFSYIADITTEVTGAPATAVPWVLAVGGLGMVIGNLIGGTATDRSLNRTILIGFPLHIAALVLLYQIAHLSLAALILGFFAINLTKTALDPPMQTWLIRIAFRSEVLGASLNHAAFNIANALGAALGGAVIAAGYGMESPMLVAIILASAGFLLVATTLFTLWYRARRAMRG